MQNMVPEKLQAAFEWLLVLQKIIIDRPEHLIGIIFLVPVDPKGYHRGL